MPLPPSSHSQQRLLIIGIGGAGCRALGMLVGIAGARRVAIDTDLRSLGPCVADVCVHLGGAKIDRGVCGNVELARTLEREARETVVGLLPSTDLAIIVAGIGGGTGEALAPVAVNVAKSLGIPAYVFAVRPFHFEGETRMAKANRAVERLQAEADGITVLNNQDIFRICSERQSALSCLEMAWRILRGECAVLSKAVGNQDIHQAILDIASGMESELDELWQIWVPITERMAWGWQPPPAYPLNNLSAGATDTADGIDIARILATRPGARCRAVGAGLAHGQQRAVECAESALGAVSGALRISSLVAIHLYGDEETSLFELDEAVNRVRDDLHPDTEILLSTAFRMGTTIGQIGLSLASISTISVDVPHRTGSSEGGGIMECLRG